jgi:hypothetical protein
MQNMKAQREKLLIDAEDCVLIARLATDRAKRELFARLAVHLKVLADHVEIAINERADGGGT